MNKFTEFVILRPGMEASFTDIQIPQCHEYCNGNTAEFYCPECSAMFCSSCYDREHCGNERKSQHGKVTELRAICCIHKHTLDYFNLTTLQPMCIICKKETSQASELSDHVIDNIETTVPKLQSLMEKKLNTASELITRLNREIAMAENAARNTTICAIEYVQECFVKIRRYLDETEEEIKQGARKYFDDFMQFNEDRVEFMNAVRKLRALSEEGRSLLTKDAKCLAVEFPSVYRRLEELCSSKNDDKQMKQLNIMIEYEKAFCEQLKHVISMTAYSSVQVGGLIILNEPTVENTADSSNNDCSPSHEITPGKRKYFPGSPPPCEDPSTKQPKSCEKEHKFTPDRSQESLGTQSRPAARTSLKIASLSPSKRSKRPCSRAIGSPRSPSCSSPKSNASSPLGGDTCKRRRRGGELSKEFQKCDHILTELWAQDESCPFARPVDKKQSPDYYKVIKNPIDLSIIKEKLHSLQYASAVDFVKDVRLMISNCRTYNPPDTYVYNAGEELENIFNRLLKISFPNFEDVFLEDSIEEEKD